MQHHVFDAALFAKTPFFVRRSVFVDHKDVGFEPVDGIHKIHHAIAVVDEGVLHIADGFHHEETFFFGIQRLVVFVVQDGLVGADADIEVAILRRLSEELDVTAV